MAGKDTLADIAQELGLALSPLRTATMSEGTFSAFMRLLGWDTAGYIPAVQNLGAIVSTILDLVEDDLDEAEALNAISQVVNFFNAVSQLSSASGLPATIDAAEFASDFPGQLVDYLVGGYFLNNFAIALFRFFSTFAGSLPEPNVFVASPRQTCFFVEVS